MRPSPEDLEQEAAFLRGLATVARVYYVSLVQAGFDAEQALELTESWQDAYLLDAGPADPE